MFRPFLDGLTACSEGTGKTFNSSNGKGEIVAELLRSSVIGRLSAPGGLLPFVHRAGERFDARRFINSMPLNIGRVVSILFPQQLDSTIRIGVGKVIKAVFSAVFLADSVFQWAGCFS